MTAMVLPVGSLLKLNSTINLSEHNRQPVSLNKIRIEKTQRMANGTMRKFFVSEKESINVSWSMLPSNSTMTVDGGYGAVDIKSFYDGTAAKASGALSGRSTFDLSIVYGGTTKTMEIERILTNVRKHIRIYCKCTYIYI